MKGAGKAALATSLLGSMISGCSGTRIGRKSLEEILGSGHYSQLTRNWDPIYGPPIQGFLRYGGLGDFQGHIRGGATPAVDYDVSKGTPLVPPMTSYVRQITRDDNGSLYIYLIDSFNPAYRILMGHLEDVLVDERYILSGDIMRYLGRRARASGRGEIVALSGNSGFGPREYGWVQPPHLHLAYYHLNEKKNEMEHLDPEKNGINGGRPVFWDGKAILDIKANKRLVLLEKMLENFKEEVSQWPEAMDLKELGGTLIESHNLLGRVKGKAILDSKHFHDIRSTLEKITLQEKKYLPGTAPYSLMLKVLGYSTEEKQEVILTLPFIAPGLEKSYQKPEYEKGYFVTIQSLQNERNEGNR